MTADDPDFEHCRRSYLDAARYRACASRTAATDKATRTSYTEAMKRLPSALMFAVLVGILNAQEASDLNLPQLELRILDLTNSERSTNGLDALRPDPALSAIARAHSTDMARIGYFDHTNPEGRDPKGRLSAAGYSCTKGVAENIFRTNLYSKVTISGNRKTYDWISTENLAANTVKELMNSRDHRRNIVDKKYQRIGVGVATSNDAKLYVTQIFCAP
jgi:uncharacterized protein YkwD